jgi:hypothetical protein
MSQALRPKFRKLRFQMIADTGEDPPLQAKAKMLQSFTRLK